MPKWLLVSDSSLPDFVEQPASTGKLQYGLAPEGEQVDDWFQRGCMTGEGFWAKVPQSFAPRALFFDMDATFVEEETLVEIARLCGTYDDVKDITTRAMAGALDFEQALRARVETLKGHPAEYINTVKNAMRLTSGVDVLVKAAQKKGVKCFLVSGGFNQLAGPLAEQMNLVGYAANELGVERDKFSGTVEGRIVDARFKATWLLDQTGRHGIAPSEAVAIGDGANDLLMMRQAGLACGFRPKAALFSSLNICNHVGDHNLLATVLFGIDC